MCLCCVPSPPDRGCAFPGRPSQLKSVRGRTIQTQRAVDRSSRRCTSAAGATHTKKGGECEWAQINQGRRQSVVQTHKHAATTTEVHAQTKRRYNELANIVIPQSSSHKRVHQTAMKHIRAEPAMSTQCREPNKRRYTGPAPFINNRRRYTYTRICSAQVPKD